MTPASRRLLIVMTIVFLIGSFIVVAAVGLPSLNEALAGGISGSTPIPQVAVANPTRFQPITDEAPAATATPRPPATVTATAASAIHSTPSGTTATLVRPGSARRTPTVPASGAGSGIAFDLLDLLNAERRKAGLNPLDTPAALTALAQTGASDMVAREDASGITIEALNDLGYFADGLSIYSIKSSFEAQGLFDYWWKSPMKDTLLDPATGAAAVGIVEDDGQAMVVLLLAVPLALNSPGSEASNAGTEQTQERLIVDLLNKARQAEGLAPLTINATLTTAAALHSADQADRDEMTHDGSDGSSVGDRVTRQGYAFATVGENVLQQSRLHAASAFDGWWNSPPHHENMMNPDFKEIGVAYVLSDEGHYFYTMVLGTSR